MSSGLSYRKLSAFFIPLAVSASLTSITHVIINGTLSRGENAAFIIACYAVAMSVFGILERPMIVFRQTSSALVTDRKSFRRLSTFFVYILIITMVLSAIIAFTPLGAWIYTTFFNASNDMVHAISIAFRGLLLVIIFSGIRGLYQGIIISQLATNWLTIGVILRLISMFLLSYLFIRLNFITSVAGSLIFLLGMMVECGISVFKGNSLLKNNFTEEPEKGKPVLKADISKFYFPLMLYFIMQAIIIPIIYILLAKSENLELSLASFSLANSITQLMLSFFMFTHQLVLQFYKVDHEKVVKFVLVLNLIPTLFLCLLCYTPLGMVFMQVVMGADETLSVATLAVLKLFIIKTLLFPLVDFMNGFLMLSRQTNKMIFAQVGNIIAVAISLIIFVAVWPHLDGVNGALAASLGELAGFIIVGIIIYRMSKRNEFRRYRGRS